MRKTKVRIVFRVLAAVILMLILYVSLRIIVERGSWKAVVNLPFALLMLCAVLVYDPWAGEK